MGHFLNLNSHINYNNYIMTTAPSPAPTPASMDPCFGVPDPNVVHDIWGLFFIITFSFFIPAALICLGANKLSSDPSFCRLVTGVATICMWMMWASVYICQANPLIRPKIRTHTE